MPKIVPTFVAGFVAMACSAPRVVADDEVGVFVKRAAHGLEPGPELLAQAAMMLDKVLRRSNPSQFAGGDSDAHWSEVGRKLEGSPLTEKSPPELTCARL